jgi:hypothetical protein
MEDFVEGLADADARRTLFSTLESKGAFRLFREYMLEHPAERASWEEFRSERLGRRIERFMSTLPESVSAVPPVSS